MVIGSSQLETESHYPTKHVRKISTMPQVANLSHLCAPCEAPLTLNQKNLSIACSSPKSHCVERTETCRFCSEL